MLARILSVLFPVFAVTAIGYLVGLRQKPDMSHANRLVADVFVPALVFGAMAGRDFHIASHSLLALAMLLVIVACGLFGALLARFHGLSHRTLVPPMMFSNSINLGVPVAVLAFGEQALQPAIVLFLVSSLVHYSFGLWLLDHQARLVTLWRQPSLLAMILGTTVSLCGIRVWEPAVLAVKMLGDISIPLMLFALGVRLTGVSFREWRLGVVTGLARPAFGMLVSFGIAQLLGIHGFAASLLVIYGALPPAVMNYIFAERYDAEPDRVASVVLLGNLLSVAVLPVTLALAL